MDTATKLDTMSLPASPSALRRTKKQDMVQGKDTTVEVQLGDQEITMEADLQQEHILSPSKRQNRCDLTFKKSSLTTSTPLQQARKPALLKTLYRNWTLQEMAKHMSSQN